jgi:hypothetical protein
MSGERGSANGNGGPVEELPRWSEVRRGTRRADRFPAGVFYRRPERNDIEEKCNRKARLRHDVTVVLKFVKALFDRRAGVVRAIVVSVRRGRVVVRATGQKVKPGKLLEQAMRGDWRPDQGESNGEKCSQARHA